MSTSTVLSVSSRSISPTTWVARAGDYLELTKPRLSALVLVTVAVGGIVASWGQPNPWLLLHAVVATGLIAASASIWNQWIERETDASMPRTSDRPIADGRVGRSEAYWLGSVTLLLGVGDLFWVVNWRSASLGLLTWILYVLVYTPLKRRTRWNTQVGALPGALPVLIGWTAMGQPIDVRGAAMFATVFLWQFPHFMAIAWKYRHQYRDAGIQMVTVTDPTGRRAGIQAVVGAVALLPVSLIPALVVPPSIVYAVVAFTLGMMMIGLSVQFLFDRSDVTARRLLRASLVYLPVVMMGLACLPLLS